MIKHADFVGYWKIARMELWDSEYIDLVVPGFLEFETNGSRLLGQFQFGTVGGGLDCRVRERGNEILVEWSWEGHNDNDPGCGRGWAHMQDGSLVGRMFIHYGDDSAFEAQRQDPPTRRRQRKAGRRRG